MCASRVSLSALVIRNNTALRSGGGLEVNDVLEQVVVKGVKIEGNKALMGGALATLAVMNFTMTADDYGGRSVIEGNTAATGGGIYLEPGQDVFPTIAVSALNNLWAPQAVNLVSLGRECNVRVQ